jgi:MYXO-CTERM domain-containing protein
LKILPTSALLAALAWSPVARGQCLTARPTEQSGSWSYDGVAARSHVTPEGGFRVWFVESGEHAADEPRATTVGQIAEAARSHFTELGYRAPLADAADAACAGDGGDDRLDIYLMHFGAADGTILLEECGSAAPIACSGFVIVENDFAAGSYGSFDEAARTVVPHEYFHLVQAAYDAELAAFWSEGTAQWATQSLYPGLRDLERFLPAYFRAPERPIDGPAGGAAQAFVYGTAIWPLYLAERFGPDSVRRVFERAAEVPGTTIEAIDGVLVETGSELSDEFPRFALWNAATGARSDPALGYARAAAYPAVPATPLDTETRALLAGLGARYFTTTGTAPRRITIETDPARNAAWLLPLSGGRADLASAAPLPATAAGDAIVVVAGRTAQKNDAPFTLRVEPADSGAEAGAEPPREAGTDAATPAPTPSESSSSGCACSVPRATASADAHAFAALLLVAFGRRKRRRSAERGPPQRRKPRAAARCRS